MIHTTLGVARRRTGRSGTAARRSGRRSRRTRPPTARRGTRRGAARCASRVCRCSARARRVAGRARHLRQLGRRHRHAEQADRQQVQRLRVRHRGDDRLAEEAREQLIDVAESCTEPRPSSTGHERAQRRSHARVATASDGRRPRSSAITVGSWTRNCAAEPITAPHASQVAMSSSWPASRAAGDDRGRDQRGVPQHRRRRRRGRTGGGC